MNLPPTKAALPSGQRPSKSPKGKEIFFGTLDRIARQPSVKKDKRAAAVLNEASVRCRTLE